MEPDAIRTMLVIAMAVATVVVVHDLMRDLDAAKETTRFLVEMMPHNAYARFLGEEVLAKVYEQSDWERCVIVAVSWHGSVCVRLADDLACKGRWIRHGLTNGRVRLP